MATASDKGEFVRKESSFRNFVTADGSSGFKSEAGRYHLYVSLACPWAHRSLFVRSLKGLTDVITVDVVDWYLDFSTGWAFTDKKPNCTLDTVNGCQFIRQIYRKSDETYDGKCTVPCMWDKDKNCIVNNESSELLRMLNSEFQEFCATPEQRAIDLYPEELREEIDSLNSWIYPQINNGVYRAGFAKQQSAYDAAVKEVFDGLDKVESILSNRRYLAGSKLTEADVKLFTTLVRFDSAYHTHFKCNKKQIVDYPNTWAYVRELYQMPGIKDTINMEHIKKHYYMSHPGVNPSQIIAVGPDLDWMAPHGRQSLE